MRKRKSLLPFCLLAIWVTPMFAGVNVSTPGNGSSVSSPVHFAATAISSCSKGVAAMGIYTAPYQLAFVVNGSSLNTNLNLNPGTYYATVQEWDNCGGATKTPITIKVGGADPPADPPQSGGGGVFSSLQADTAGWTGYALLPPSYSICGGCKSGGPNATWSWTPGITNPSSDGKSVKTTIGGKEAFSDILWNNHLIGDFSSQGLPDSSRTLVPKLHNFTYDVWFYLSNNGAPQALEFDINQFVNGKSFIWGHECRVAGGHQWDTWSNPGQHWVPSGIACNPVTGWNHLILKVQRTSGDQLLFQSITLNGITKNLNRTDSPTPRSWYGVTINYQIDGDRSQTPYAVYLDKLNFTWQP